MSRHILCISPLYFGPAPADQDKAVTRHKWKPQQPDTTAQIGKARLDREIIILIWNCFAICVDYHYKVCHVLSSSGVLIWRIQSSSEHFLKGCEPNDSQQNTMKLHVGFGMHGHSPLPLASKM